MAHQGHHHKLLNFPEENDETQSEEFHSGLPLASKTSLNHSIPLSRVVEGQTFSHQHNAMSPCLTQSCVKLIQHDQLTRPCQQVLYPNQVDTDGRDQRAHPCYHSKSLGGGQTSSLPSYLPSTENQTYLGAGCVFPSWHNFHPGTHSLSLNSLDQPGSLHSFLAAGSTVHTNQLMPFHSGYYGPVPIQVDPQDHLIPRPGYQPPHRLKDPELLGYTHPGSTKNDAVSFRPGQKSVRSTQLSQEQSERLNKKVFVTYEVDSEDHLKEVIKFVALLRNNGFDMHIDVFEQQLYSISKIDCMERYLNEKDYLIIMVISLKYFETVTGAGVGVDCDERTSNTVYIHKQLQSEFIQNGCRNFRVIPVLFPGAKKSYVPFWLQNTHLYSWPRDRDDILRRLMQVEKYNPPPVGSLPTIFSMPI